MNGWSELDRFLQTDPRDVGCTEAMRLLHVYVDLVAQGADAAQRYPGIAPRIGVTLIKSSGPVAHGSTGSSPSIRRQLR